MKLSKNLGRIATTFLATAMLASVSAVPAFAADYSPVNGGTTTFDKYLVMDNDANVPTANFTFDIGASEGVLATASTPEVKGTTDAMADLVTVENASFVPGQTTYDVAQTNDTLTLGENEKYAFDEVTVDFSAVSFSTPGIYRFTVTESGNVNGVTNDTTRTRYIDVYVVDTDGTLRVTNYILHNGTGVPDNSDDNGTDDNGVYDDKATGFTNTYATQNVTLTKQVEGNMGDKSKPFAFTIEITSAGGAKSYTIEASDSTSYDPITTTLNEDETAYVGSATVNLSDGESVTIKGLSTGDTYTITETAVAGYNTKIATGTTTSSEDATITGTEYADKTVNDATAVTFYNISDASTPTGIVMNVAPYVLLVVVAAAGCFVFLRKRRED